MANKPGLQPDVIYCPFCKNELYNLKREEMKTKGYVRKDGTVSPYTHTYHCESCGRTFEEMCHAFL